MRKLIKRYEWGGTSTWGPYTIPQNNASNTYMGITGIPNYAEQLLSFSNNLNNSTNSLINSYANTGDLFSLSLKIDKSNKSNRPLDINKIADLSSGVADILKSPSTGKSASTDSLKKGMSAGAQKGLLIAGLIAGAVYDNIPSLDKVHNENDATTSELRGGINKTLMSGAAGPWGIAAGLVNTVIDKTGGFTDASQGLGKGLDAANMAASFLIPGAGWFTGKTIDYKVSDTLRQNGSSYGGTLDKANTAELNAGAKILFGKGKANEMIAAANLADIKVGNIVDKNNLALTASNNPLIGIGTLVRLNGGYQLNGVKSGKSGLKLDKEFAKRVVKLSKGKKNKEVAEFKNGGAVNVIPDGALHKNKHHLENVDEKFEEVTAKGIPVITESEGGDITQHAEVEREEIIFNLDVTKQLEKLMEDGSDDAAIEAGKLLVHEILENTIDNAGIMDKV